MNWEAWSIILKSVALLNEEFCGSYSVVPLYFEHFLQDHPIWRIITKTKNKIIFLDEIYLYVCIFLVSLEQTEDRIEEQRRGNMPSDFPLQPSLSPTLKYNRKSHVSTIHVYLSIPSFMKHPLASFQLLLFCIKQLKKCSLRVLGSIAVHSWCPFFFFFPFQCPQNRDGAFGQLIVTLRPSDKAYVSRNGSIYGSLWGPPWSGKMWSWFMFPQQMTRGRTEPTTY